MYFTFTRMPGESHPRRFRFLWLWSCDVFGALITSLCLMNQRGNKRINRLKLWLIVIKIFHPPPPFTTTRPPLPPPKPTPTHPFLSILSVRLSLIDHFYHSVFFRAVWAGGRPFARCCPCPMTRSGWKPNPNWIHFPCRFHPVTKGVGGVGGGGAMGVGGGGGGARVEGVCVCVCVTLLSLAT